QIFSRIWNDGAREMQRGYLTMMDGVPRGLKLRRAPDDKEGRVNQWLSARGTTLAMQKVRRWGAAPDQVEPLLSKLWTLLTDELQLLVPVTLTGYANRPLPGTTGVYQIDADKLRMTAHKGFWR
ncbi:MAG: hypothetical protein KDE31_28300, partial [Caldilineaceae bacterium]|nr:hypothetical protein [Caldilineaceae bacterium]